MKHFRTALIAALVLVCSGFAYWYFEIKGRKEKQQEASKESLLFEETKAPVEKIVIKNEGDEIVMERISDERAVPEGSLTDTGEDAGYRWMITSPVVTRGDTYAVDELVSTIKEAKKEEVVYESLEKQKEYGLDDPSASLRFYLSGDERPHGIDFGIESLDGTKVFAKTVGKQMILSVPAAIKNGLIKSLFDLRDKMLAYFKAEDVVEISYLSSRGAFVLRREEDQWYLMPGRVKASNTRVEMYIGTLIYDHFVEVVQERADEVARYGLMSPRLIASFTLKDGTDYLFLAGDSVKRGDKEYFYATRSTDRMVFQVKFEVVAGLARTEFDMRDRRIFDFEDKDVSGITLTRLGPGKTGAGIALERDGEKWRFQDTGETVERDYVVESILRGVKNAEYEEREPVSRGDNGWGATGIENPVFETVFTFGSGRPPLTVRMTAVDDETKMMWLSPDGGDTAYFTTGYFMSFFPNEKKELLE
ncbi:MAG: DUF4340 domain-containing protein [Spirochaetes bacterium]|nr:DUF4340 domain-containing protein [Spirochaetota bacterium]